MALKRSRERSKMKLSEERSMVDLTRLVESASMRSLNEATDRLDRSLARLVLQMEGKQGSEATTDSAGPVDDSIKELMRRYGY